jgi:hypothetical protein
MASCKIELGICRRPWNDEDGMDNGRRLYALWGRSLTGKDVIARLGVECAGTEMSEDMHESWLRRLHGLVVV